MSPSVVDSNPASAPPAAAKTGSGAEEVDVGVLDVPKVSDPWTIEKVVDTMGAGKYEEGSSSPLPYFHLLERLKTTKREGWRRFGINRGESISDHQYRMAMISMFPPPALAAKLDLFKCQKMCLIHDMAESLVGDITPVDNVPKPEKSRREGDTMTYITRTLLGNVTAGTAAATPGLVGEEIRAVWQEYEDSRTIDSHYVHDIDKLELLLQMVAYEKRGEGRLDLGEFAYVATKMTLPEMRELGQNVLKEREEFWKGRGEHIRGDQGVEGGVETDLTGQQSAYYQRDGQ